jgi:hypothetical protein
MEDDRSGLLVELTQLDDTLRRAHADIEERYFVRKAPQHSVQTVSWTDGVAW